MRPRLMLAARACAVCSMMSDFENNQHVTASYLLSHSCTRSTNYIVMLPNTSTVRPCIVLVYGIIFHFHQTGP